jgi:hypothetical protein
MSADGARWVRAGSESLALPDTVFVGAAVTSRDAVAVTSANVSDLNVGSTAPTLPNGWASVDVGSAPSSGSVMYSNGAFLAVASGAGLVQTSDAFRFVYVRVQSDTQLIARVVAVYGSGDPLAGITLRSSLDPGAAHVSLVAGANGISRVRRAADGGVTASQVSPSPGTPVWLKLERVGNVVTASTSRDGREWALLGSDGLAASADLYAGLIVMNGGRLPPGAAAFDEVSLMATPANHAPVVSMTRPTTGTTAVAGQAMTLEATASDPDDRVSRVDFFVNDSAVGSDTSAPYTGTWTPAAAGTYVVTAIARDDDGAASTSSPATVTVVAAGSSGGSGATPSLPSNPSTPSTPSTTPSSPSSSTSPGTSTNPGSGSDATPSPWRLAFEPSVDDVRVSYYTVEFSLAATHALVAARNIGKPAIGGDGLCTVDIDSTIKPLVAGLYVVVVRAVGDGGETPSAPIAFTK